MTIRTLNRPPASPPAPAPEAPALPPLPEIGRAEGHYAGQARRARATYQDAAYHANKAAQYITLGLDRAIGWDRKLRYFRHALDHHSYPPPFPDEPTWLFYQGVADLVRRHAGAEALRLACQEDDLYAARLAMGQAGEVIEAEAEKFFLDLVPIDGCPEWFNAEDYAQLKLVRDHWI